MTNDSGVLTASAAASCVSCGAGPVMTSFETDRLLYGAIQPVTIVVEDVPVHRCGACGLMWTDDVAERLRDDAVRRYRAEHS